jgi:threonine dehydrogenase-like Zn-dependent dehydrogenase
MRAVTLDYEHRTLDARNVPEPSGSLAPKQVLFRIHAAGVCGTDRELAQFNFGYPPAGDPFMILGHEAAGEVIAVGSAVGDVRPGDCVAPMIRRACSPPCDTCAHGRRDFCLTGRYTERGIFGAHGYFTEYATDSEEDLYVIPADRAEFAVLVEPLSVVEKAVGRALIVHPWNPETALVIGAGTIGILAGLVVQARGLKVTLESLEPAKGQRAKLVESAGLNYTNRFEGTADIIIEAAGSADAAMAGIARLRQMGVLIILGAKHGSVEFPFLQMIVGNQVVLGSVNASPESARSAVEHLRRFDRAILDAMIERVPFDTFRTSILNPAAQRPKIVHMLS